MLLQELIVGLGCWVKRIKRDSFEDKLNVMKSLLLN